MLFLLQVIQVIQHKISIEQNSIVTLLPVCLSEFPAIEPSSFIQIAIWAFLPQYASEIKCTDSLCLVESRKRKSVSKFLVIKMLHSLPLTYLLSLIAFQLFKYIKIPSASKPLDVRSAWSTPHLPQLTPIYHSLGPCSIVNLLRRVFFAPLD